MCEEICVNRALVTTSSPVRFMRRSRRSTSTRTVSATRCLDESTTALDTGFASEIVSVLSWMKTGCRSPFDSSFGSRLSSPETLLTTSSSGDCSDEPVNCSASGSRICVTSVFSGRLPNAGELSEVSSLIDSTPSTSATVAISDGLRSVATITTNCGNSSKL